MDSNIRKQVMGLIREKLQRIGIRENELGENFDLVKSGLLNSLEFVDMVASMEKIYQNEIDFEEALDSGEFTTLGGLIRAFKKKKMMEDLNYIRLLEPENKDWEAVGELFSQMYARMDEMGLMLPLSRGGTEKWLKTAKNTAGKFGMVILAKKGEKAVGFAHGMIKFLPDYLGGYAVGSITHIYIEDDYRRSGIGIALINLLEEWFRAKKVHSVELQVITGNPVAKEFWKNLGYLEELQQYRKTSDQW